MRSSAASPRIVWCGSGRCQNFAVAKHCAPSLPRAAVSRGLSAQEKLSHAGKRHHHQCLGGRMAGRRQRRHHARLRRRSLGDARRQDRGLGGGVQHRARRPNEQRRQPFSVIAPKCGRAARGQLLLLRRLDLICEFRRTGAVP
jgi:hypothetical protein